MIDTIFINHFIFFSGGYDDLALLYFVSFETLNLCLRISFLSSGGIFSIADLIAYLLITS